MELPFTLARGLKIRLVLSVKDPFPLRVGCTSFVQTLVGAVGSTSLVPAAQKNSTKRFLEIGAGTYKD